MGLTKGRRIMKRKEFIKKTIKLGMASGPMLLFKGKKSAANSLGQQPEEKASDLKQKFQEEWIKSLLNNMDKLIDQEKRMKLMESCGRDCALRSSAAAAISKSSKGDVDKLVSTMRQLLGENNVLKKDGVIQLIYSQCYCPLVEEWPARLSDTYCYCSLGWIKEVFETVSGKPVGVDLLQSIKRGDPFCKFTIHL
jgi:predicted hydrocarbon binding protein